MGVVVATRTATSLGQSAWTAAVKSLMPQWQSHPRCDRQNVTHIVFSIEKQSNMQRVPLTDGMHVDTRSENRWTAGRFILESDLLF